MMIYSFINIESKNSNLRQGDSFSKVKNAHNKVTNANNLLAGINTEVFEDRWIEMLLKPAR